MYPLVKFEEDLLAINFSSWSLRNRQMRSKCMPNVMKLSGPNMHATGWRQERL